MKQSKFSILNKYFKCQQFELSKNAQVYNTFKNHYEASVDEYKYGVGIIETQTNHIFVLGLSNEVENYESFEYYLQQLPNLDLQTVVLLFSVIGANAMLVENIFYMPDNFPSSFVAELLKDTYGKIVFSYQFLQLLQCCLPIEENEHKQIIEYRRQFNCRMASFFNKLQKLYLPDGYNLYELLKEYTPARRTNEIDSEFGFVIQPSYKLAYQFIQSSKKYITK